MTQKTLTFDPRLLRIGKTMGSIAMLVALGANPARGAADSSTVLAAASAPAASISSDDLGPTSDVPWNPPEAIARRRAWERTLLLPGRIVSLPLVGVGYLMDHGLLYVEETALVQRGANLFQRGLPERAALSIKPSRLGDRTGLGLTVGARTPFLSGNLRNRIRLDVSGTTRKYTSTVFRVSGQPGTLEYEYNWRPQQRFYGLGIESSEDDASTYASQEEFIRGNLVYAWNRETDTDLPRTALRGWAGPRNLVTRTGRESGVASWDDRFPALAAPTLDRRVEHLVYGASFSTDWRVGEPHWSRGWRALLSVERFDQPVPWLALRVGEPRGAQFTRYEFEHEMGFSFHRDPRTIRFATRLMDQNVTSGRERFLPGDMALLGGRQGLGGFVPGRFHDLDGLVTRVSYIFPLVRRLELDLHTEWGGVYPNLWEDAKLTTLENSYGVALRGRLKEHPWGSIGFDFSRESVRLRYSFGAVE